MNADRIFWVTDGDPDHWHVAVGREGREGREDPLDFFAGNLSGFLCNVLIEGVPFRTLPDLASAPRHFRPQWPT